MMTMNELQEWSYQNWLKINPLIRQDCLNELIGWIKPYDIQLFKTELEQGEPMGGPGFHLFGGGMQIRNRLRNQLLDSELPAVIYPDGQKFHNWDDYYMGALKEFVLTDGVIKNDSE